MSAAAEAGEPLVAPFRGERFSHDRLRSVIAPPYDVISPSERATLALSDPQNIVHLILPEGEEDRYENAAETLSKWRDLGALMQDDEPSMYVVQQEFRVPDGSTQLRTGVIGAVAAEPYAAGRVRPHERTHAGPKADRLALLRATRATFESLFMLSRDENGLLRRLLALQTTRSPLASGTMGETTVRMWRANAAESSALARAAGERLYIADGHHRYETAAAYRGENLSATRTAALIVPLQDPGLVVLPTHRLIHGSPIDSVGARVALGHHFTIEDLAREDDAETRLKAVWGAGTSSVVVLPEGRWLLRLKPDLDLARLDVAEDTHVRTLDIARIDALVVRVLKSMAGAQARVGYTADGRVLSDEVTSGGAAAGVLLNPTDIRDVLTVADSGGVMPQKSTYFIPKVPSGMVGLRYDP